MGEIEVREYLDEDGRSAFGRWFDRLDSTAASKINIAVVRMESGNLSNVKGVGHGVFEYRVNFGPGYRIYFGRDGDTLIILLGGGSKQRQQRDIEDAQFRWRRYRERKRTET